MHHVTVPIEHGEATPGTAALRVRRRETAATVVVLIEDQELLAGAIQTALRSVADLRLAGTSSTLAEARELVRTTRPDVIVSDYQLADGVIPDALPQLLEDAAGATALVFTGWPNENSLVAAMAAGAAGFIDKATSFDQFVDAIRRVADGQVVVSPRFLPMLTRRATEQDPTNLSRRELEVLQMLAEGRSTAEIADRMILSIHTVRNHIARLFNKLGVNSRLEAVNAGLCRGLIRHGAPAS